MSKAYSEGYMLFGVDFCRRGQRVKKRRPPRWDLRIFLILLAAAVVVTLLFLAPQWLLVLLVLLLTGAVIAAVCRIRR